MKNAWDVVEDFEESIADYTGAPYAVGVDSCTNALLLALTLHRQEHGPTEITVPKHTYVGVAQAVLNSGNTIKFEYQNWGGWYALEPTNIYDSARRFRRNMYVRGTDTCLSFHWGKHLPIGRGGAILTDSVDKAEMYIRMRYDGREPGIAPADDTFIRGYHCMMSPNDAAQGLLLMQYVKDWYEDLPWDGYGDLSKQEVFNVHGSTANNPT